MGKNTFKYILFCMGTFLTLTIIEIFLMKPLFDFISDTFWGSFWIYTIIILAVNPVLTKMISDKIDFTIKVVDPE